MATRRLQAVQAPLTKAARQAAIVELLESRAIASQTELGKLLFDKGVQVTQATLSRDLDELGAYETRTPQGTAYAVPPEGMPRPAAPEDVDNGTAVFAAGENGQGYGKPLDIEIPQYAYFRQEDKYVIVLQAENYDGQSIIGAETFDGEKVVGLIEEFDLLGVEAR